MKVGKKPIVVEAKKTRPCVVRLPKVFATSNSKYNKKVITNTTSLKNASQDQVEEEDEPQYPQMNEKMFKGPLKKRPISDGSKTPATAIPRGKEKVKATPKRELVETPPPTIAASRSRRSIKPNPKYASEDIVTPKMIRTASMAKKNATTSITAIVKQEYDSSSEDFFNKETSDESEDEVKILDKPFDIDDTDGSDMEVIKVETVVKKPRGRPKKIVIEDNNISTYSKSTPSQLQQLRKSLANQVARPTITSVPFKRKLDKSDTPDSISRKRILLASGGVRIIKESKSEGSMDNSPRKNLPVSVPTNKKLSTESIAVSATQSAQEQRRTLMAKTLARTGINISPKAIVNTSPKSTTTSPNEKTGLQKSVTSRVLSVAKRRSASPISIRQTKETKKNLTNDMAEDDPVGASTTSGTDDFESMPTFTIVNINDIINKKGDALISRSSPPPKNLPTTKVQKSDDKFSENSTTKLPTIQPGKQVRRRGPVPKILSEKANADKNGNVNSIRGTPNAQKKPPPTILNHTLKNNAIKQRQARGSPIIKHKAPDKPAPRILNSMVAKKTEPVKPLIANLDDSADESFPLSMDENESDEDIDNDSNTEMTYSNKTKANKHTLPVAKENSSSITNCLSPNHNNNKLATLKTSPEKVVIQRQGDKIIKKVTCFENWYVLNINEDDKPQEPVRNQLEIPLIKLANITEDITLPTDSWTAKVTLYELSPATLATSTFITYTGDLSEHNIAEEDRAKYQPSCVMFRRSVAERNRVRLPYDRAVIFKNKTFFTNIEGKNVKLLGAPSTISNQDEVEILLEVVNDLTLNSIFVEPATTTQ